jgi:N-acetylmuramoyl-L-alanine amidase
MKLSRMRWLLVLAIAFATFFSPAETIAKPTVVLDPGHGGHDRGGVPRQRVGEKAVTLAVAQKTASKLRAAGFRVVMTRSGDYFVGLGQRCAIANSQGNAIFLSIHMNAAPRLTATGVETYYYSSRSARLGASVHREVLRVMGTENRGLRRRGFYVIRNTRCPAVLIEAGFLTNAGEARRLSSSSFQGKLAGAIAKAVEAVY